MKSMQKLNNSILIMKLHHLTLIMLCKHSMVLPSNRWLLRAQESSPKESTLRNLNSHKLNLPSLTKKEELTMSEQDSKILQVSRRKRTINHSQHVNQNGCIGSMSQTFHNSTPLLWWWVQLPALMTLLWDMTMISMEKPHHQEWPKKTWWIWD